MTPPSTIVIGPMRARVAVDELEHNRACREQKRDLLGSWSGRELLITVEPGMPHDQIVDTLVHEVLHAIVDIHGVDLGDEEREERVVGQLSPVLVDTLRRNPHLVAFITTTDTLPDAPVGEGYHR
jgi:hypothetical protein